MLKYSLRGLLEDISLPLCLYLRYGAALLHAAASWVLRTSLNTFPASKNCFFFAKV